MKHHTFVVVTFAVVTLVACGRSLISDPSFDLWCGNKLCAPWEASGKVTRVKTWHRSDFGAELGDSAVLSQLSTENTTHCIEFEVVADVTANAAVYLEMDFNDDGSSEFTQLIPESHWAKLAFNADTPRSYRSVRFILRKTGAGRAVLAQIKATSGTGCNKPLPETDRELGQSCMEDKQCASGMCEARNDALKITNDNKACGECGDAAACPEDMRCGSLRGKNGVYATCVPREQEAGALCDNADQCRSGLCVESLLQHESVCSTCTTDDDCSEDQVCGWVPTKLGPSRGCRNRNEAKLGQLCQTDAECASGVCSAHQCGECDGKHACADQSSCGAFENTTGLLLVAGVSLCGGPSGGRASGSACYEDSDCMSQGCDVPEVDCFLCYEENCDQYSETACLLLRQRPGTCR